MRNGHGLNWGWRLVAHVFEGLQHRGNDRQVAETGQSRVSFGHQAHLCRRVADWTDKMDKGARILSSSRFHCIRKGGKREAERWILRNSLLRNITLCSAGCHSRAEG